MPEVHLNFITKEKYQDAGKKLSKFCDTCVLAYATGIQSGFQLEWSCDECVRSNFQFNRSFDICVLSTMYLYIFVFGKHLSIHSNRNRNETLYAAK